MDRNPAVNTILGNDREGLQKPATDSLYINAQQQFISARENFISGNCSTLDYLKAEIAFDTAQLKYNETGALIADANKDLITELFIGTKDISINEQTGTIVVDPQDFQKVMLKATLPSLAQINAAENHEGGNKALHNTVQILENSKDNNNPFVFHQRGGDFLIGFDNADQNTADSHIATIESAKWQKIKGTNDEPYLLAETVSLGDALEAFNKLQALKAILSPHEVITHQGDIEKEIVNIGNDILNCKIEYRKCKEMCLRFWEDFNQTSSSDKTVLEVYYNSFLKSYFQPAGVNSLDEMITLVRNNPAVAIDTIAYKRAMDTLDLKENLLRGNVLREYLNPVDRNNLSSAEIAQINTTRNEDGLTNVPIEELTELARGLERRFPNEKINKERSGSLSSLEPPTEHSTQAYRELYQAWKTVKAIMDIGTLNNKLSQHEAGSLIDLAALEIDISIADINFNVKDKILSELGDPIEGENLKSFINLINQRYVNFYNRLDALTAIPNRESFYRETSERILRSLSTGETVSLTMIDLAFLNYFNRIANRATGDVAINRSFAQLEENIDPINMNSLLPTRFYRYAGDEKVIISEGKEEVVEEMLLNLNAHGKPIPVAGKYAFDYIPVGIQYNFGSANIYMAEECFELTMLDQDKETQGIAEARRPLRAIYMLENFDASKMTKTNDPEYAKRFSNELNFLNQYLQLNLTGNMLDQIELIRNILPQEKANILDSVFVSLSNFPIAAQKEYALKMTKAMVLISDCFIDYQKANSRFNFLFEKYQQAKRTNSTESEEYRLLQYLIAFSGKALKGLDITILAKIDEMYNADDSIEPWDQYQKIMLSKVAQQETNNEQEPLSLRSKIIMNISQKLSQI
jgi:GGDEF domain-containing protein